RLYVRVSSSLPRLLLIFASATSTRHLSTLSLHDALPIWKASTPRASQIRPVTQADRVDQRRRVRVRSGARRKRAGRVAAGRCPADRKSTRLNSSHVKISYAVLCLKKNKKRYFSPQERHA